MGVASTKKKRLQGFGLARRGEREEKLSELLMTASGGSKDVGASFCRFGEPESFPFGDALNVTARASYADTRFPVFLRPYRVFKKERITTCNFGEIPNRKDTRDATYEKQHRH